MFVIKDVKGSIKIAINNADDNIKNNNVESVRSVIFTKNGDVCLLGILFMNKGTIFHKHSKNSDIKLKSDKNIRGKTAIKPNGMIFLYIKRISSIERKTEIKAEVMMLLVIKFKHTKLIANMVLII